jgi:hypothetical protein
MGLDTSEAKVPCGFQQAAELKSKKIRPYKSMTCKSKPSLKKNFEKIFLSLPTAPFL